MGDKTIIPRFFSPILFYFIPHYSYPPFPTPRFWCGFSLGMGILWEKREIFFFIPHYNYPPFFEKNKLAIFFILSAILQLSPTTIIPPPPLPNRSASVLQREHQRDVRAHSPQKADLPVKRYARSFLEFSQNFQLTFLHPPVRVTVGEVRYSIEIDVGGGKGSILQNQILRKILAENGPHV